MSARQLVNTPTRVLVGTILERLFLRVAIPVLNRLPESTMLRVRSGPLRGALWAPRAFGPRCWLGTYELDKQHWFVEHARRGGVVHDIGAHTGFYTLLASRLVGAEGRVVAFEPLPRNLKFVRSHLEANSISNVTVVEGAVGDTPGEVFFDTSKPSDMGAVSESGSLRVKLHSVDDLVERGEIPVPTVMKIDVEGAEESVLRGARRTIGAHKPVIMLATHAPDIFERCADILGTAGYRLHGPAFDRGPFDEILALPAAK